MYQIKSTVHAAPKFDKGKAVKVVATLTLVTLLLSSAVAPQVYLANEYLGDGGDKSTRADASMAGTVGGSAIAGATFLAGGASYASGTAATALAVGSAGLAATGVGLIAVGAGLGV